MPPTVDFAVTQHIPVADHVYKYLRTRCGSDFVDATRNTFIGNLVLSIQGRNYDVIPSPRKFTKIFNITVPAHKYDKVGLHITNTNAQIFNTLVDKMFREELFCHVLIVKNADKKLYLKSIRSFLNIYGIDEDDIKLDSLYRDFKRKKKELEDNLNLKKKGQF